MKKGENDIRIRGVVLGQKSLCVCVWVLGVGQL